jgi:hypothetical protein
LQVRDREVLDRKIIGSQDHEAATGLGQCGTPFERCRAEAVIPLLSGDKAEQETTNECGRVAGPAAFDFLSSEP